jgi:hypothetical protein
MNKWRPSLLRTNFTVNPVVLQNKMAGSVIGLRPLLLNKNNTLGTLSDAACLRPHQVDAAPITTSW